MTDFKIGEVVIWNNRLHKIVGMSSVLLEDLDGDIAGAVQLPNLHKVCEKDGRAFAEIRRERIQAKINALTAERDAIKQTASD